MIKDTAPNSNTNGVWPGIKQTNKNIANEISYQSSRILPHHSISLRPLEKVVLKVDQTLGFGTTSTMRMEELAISAKVRANAESRYVKFKVAGSDIRGSRVEEDSSSS